MSDEPMKLTYGQIAEIGVGLSSLDGLRTKPDEFRPYKFDDENDTTWLIASNSAAIADALKVHDRAKKLLAIQHGISDGPVKITEANCEKIAAFMQALAALEDKEVAVTGLAKISRARLKVGKGDKANPIPPSVLAKLMPILGD